MINYFRYPYPQPEGDTLFQLIEPVIGKVLTPGQQASKSYRPAPVLPGLD